jgi:hypothetical protein
MPLAILPTLKKEIREVPRNPIAAIMIVAHVAVSIVSPYEL